MQRASSSVFGALLLAAVSVAVAAEEAAPLESTKKELQQLQSAQKTQSAAATATEGLKMNAPVLEMPSAGLSASEWWLANKNKQDHKREQQQRDAENWLLNGVDKLGRENVRSNGKAAAGPQSKSDEDVTVRLDPSDPQYLLKLFDDQRKHPDPKQAESKSHATAAPDPFAPFLQGWLGSSPVRDQVLGQLAKRNDANGVTPVSTTATDFRAPGTPVASVAGREAVGAEKPNPYLVELNAPLPAKDLPAGVNATLAQSPSFLAPDATRTPATVVPATSLPDARTPAKGPPPGPADDKKYFPQLKKF